MFMIGPSADSIPGGGNLLALSMRMNWVMRLPVRRDSGYLRVLANKTAKCWWR